MDRYEEHVERVRMILAYVDQATAYQHLLADGIEPNVAFLAVKGAVTLERTQTWRN